MVLTPLSRLTTKTYEVSSTLLSKGERGSVLLTHLHLVLVLEQQVVLRCFQSLSSTRRKDRRFHEDQLEFEESSRYIEGQLTMLIVGVCE